MIELEKSLQLPYNSYSVKYSAVEHEYIGKGYGSKMYLCVLNDVDYLRSDKLLYIDSLNMWVNYLPKKVNVWAYNSDLKKGKIMKITETDFIPPKDVNFYIGSKKRDKLYRIA